MMLVEMSVYWKAYLWFKLFSYRSISVTVSNWKKKLLISTFFSIPFIALSIRFSILFYLANFRRLSNSDIWKSVNETFIWSRKISLHFSKRSRCLLIFFIKVRKTSFLFFSEKLQTKLSLSCIISFCFLLAYFPSIVSSIYFLPY